MGKITQELSWEELERFSPRDGKYLYLLGRIYSPDKGCPDWGSNKDEDTYYPGDCAGKLVITY